MQEKIKIFNRNGQKLAAILHTPEKETDKIIIISHSFKADKEYDTIGANFSQKVCEQGYAVLRFDCYGSGDSDGEFKDSSLYSQVDDLKDVIKFVEGKDYNQICLAGLSQGAAMSILACSNNIKSLILWSPALDLRILHEMYREKVEEDGFIIRKRTRDGMEIKVGKKMWESHGEIKVFEHIKNIKCPTLIVCGSEDKRYIKFVHEHLDKFSCEKKLEIIENADHDFLDLTKENQAVNLSISWLKQYF